MRDSQQLEFRPEHKVSEVAALSFLTRYQGQTLNLYSIHLKILFAWCEDHSLDPLELKRVHLELFKHYLTNDRGNSNNTVHHRLAVIKHFYRFAAADEYIPKSPAENLLIPKSQRDESRLIALDRHDVSALIATARRKGPDRWALVSLMALLGLRVSEACSIQIEDTRDIVKGYRVIRLIGKGNKPATMPVTVPVARAIDAAAGNRDIGPLLRTGSGKQLYRRAAARWVNTIAKDAGLEKKVHPHALRHAFVTLSLDAGVSLRDVQFAARHADPRMTERYDRARGSLDRHATHYLSAYLAGAH